MAAHSIPSHDLAKVAVDGIRIFNRSPLKDEASTANRFNILLIVLSGTDREAHLFVYNTNNGADSAGCGID
jgi:hypothetical protein